MTVELSDSPTTDQTALTPAAQRICDFLDHFAACADTLLSDDRRALGPGVVPAFADAGLLGLQIPEKWGGQGLSHRSTLQVYRKLGSLDCNLAILTAVHNAVGVQPVLDHATEAMQERVLPLFAGGRSLAGSAASEDGMGSNIRGMTTQAVRQADGSYVINGGKHWISLGGEARYLNVFARLSDPDGQDLGYAGFLVDTYSSGFVLCGEERTVGLRAVPQHAIRFENLRVPAEGLLGREGEGLTAANSAFMLARLVLGASALGAAKRDLGLAHRFAHRREVATGLLAENGNTSIILADAAAANAAVDALLEHVTAIFDDGETPHDLLFFITKIVSTELMHSVIDRALQMLGARGYIENNLVGKDWRDYRLFRIFEGATEAITPYVGKRIQRNPEVFRELIDAAGELPPPIADRLAEVDTSISKLIDQARDRIAREGEDQQVHVLHHAIGDLTCYSVLAATACSPNTLADDIQAHIPAWCDAELERRLAAARRSTTLTIPRSSAVAAHIEGYWREICPLPNGAGERHARDPLLS